MNEITWEQLVRYLKLNEIKILKFINENIIEVTFLDGGYDKYIIK